MVVLAVIHLVHDHLHRFWNYLQDYQSCDRIPVRQMKQTQAVLMGGFLLAFLFCTGLGLMVPWKEIGGRLGGGILAVIRWLVQFLPHSEEAVMEETMGAASSPGMWMPTAESASVLAVVLERITEVLSAVLGLYALIRLLRYGFQKLAELLGRIHFDEDERVFLKPESRKKQIRQRRKPFWNRCWSRYLPVWERTPAGRIRRMFWKLIRDRMGNQKRSDGRRLLCRFSSMTPMQLEEAAGIPKQNQDPIHVLYEKARYGCEECTRQEEAQMKECCRRLRSERG